MSIFRRFRRKPAEDGAGAEQDEGERGLVEPEPQLVELPADELAGDPPPALEEADEPSESELALLRLEDRIGAFASYTLAADLLELRELYGGTFERMKEEDWLGRSDRRPEGWTRRQALAHLDASTYMFSQAIEAGLQAQAVSLPGLAERADLREVNRAALEARAETPVPDLAASFLDALERLARLAALLDGEGLGRLTPVPFFGAAPTVAELLGSTLAHAGIIHGAQLAVSRSRPIWIFFQPGMMRRQITRFFHMFGLSYWPERGADLHATFGFNVAGQGGGSWFVRVGPGGGLGKIGVARTNDVSFSFASAELCCKLITFQAPIWRALALRQLRVSGNLRLARRLPGLFLPA